MTRIRLPRTLLACCAGTALALPAAAAAQSANDFQLPPNPSPTPTGPAVQGPVDEEAPVAAARPTVSPTADAPAPTPTPTATRPPRLTVTPTPQPRSTPAPRATATVAAPVRVRTQVPPPASTGEPLSPTTTPQPLPTTSFPDSLPPSSDGAGMGLEPVGEGEAPSWWPWIAALTALLAAIAGFAFWRRRTAFATPAIIAPPLPASDAAPPVSARAWLDIEARPVQLRRSMMNAALGYCLTLANRSGAVLEGLSIEADLATAHGRAPVEQQLASAASPLTARHTLDRLAPGERIELEGELQIPLSEVKVIRQGRALLAVPLLRLRAAHPERAAIAKTYVIGQTNPQPGGRLRPFRLDAPPQTYTAIGARGLD